MKLAEPAPARPPSGCRARTAHSPAASCSAPREQPSTTSRSSTENARRRDRWPLRTESHDVFACEERAHRACRTGRRARARSRVDRRVDLAAERAAVGERTTPAHRRAAHHDASGSRYAGSTQLVASRTPPAGSAGSGQRWPRPRPSSVDPAPSRPATRGLGERLAHDPGGSRPPRRMGTSLPGGSGTATSASRGAVSSAKPPGRAARRGRPPGGCPPRGRRALRLRRGRVTRPGRDGPSSAS